MTEHKLTLFADYFQFFIEDDGAQEDPALEGNDTAPTTRVIVQDTRCVMITARNMDVPVTVAVSDEAPACNLDAWDHIVELPIHVPSGKLVIAGCTDYLPDAARIAVPAGSLRVRALFGDLDKLSEDQLEGDDHYRVEIWPAPHAALEVRKQYNGPGDT